MCVGVVVFSRVTAARLPQGSILHFNFAYHVHDTCAPIIICVTLLLPVTYFVVHIRGTNISKLSVQIKIVKLYIIYKSLTKVTISYVLGYRFSRVLGGGST